MALLHRATITPTKLDAIAAWLPAQPWHQGSDRPRLTGVGAFRFDDPAGEVGVETLLVREGSGPVLQVPLTYRATPLPGADASLVTTMEHSVLGRRWVYDGCGDPVYLATVADVVLGRARQAEELLDGAAEPRPPTATVVGNRTGTAPVEPLQVVVHRVPGTGDAGGHTLTGTWAGQDEPALLVSLTG